MTPVAFVCPQCHAKYKAKQSPAPDMKLTCQKCQAVFKPAENLVASAAAKDVPVTAAQPAETKVAPPKPASKADDFKIELPPPGTGGDELSQFPDFDFTPPSQMVPPELPFVVQEDEVTTDILKKGKKGKTVSPTRSATYRNPQKSKATSGMTLIAGGVVGIAVLVGVIAFLNSESAPPIPTPEDLQRNVNASASPAANALAERKPEAKPRTPIDLLAIPSGVRLFVHFNLPQLLKADGDQAREQAVKYILSSPIGKSLEEAIHRPLEQVETLLVGVLLGPVGSQPEFAYRVQLTNEAPTFDPAAEFSATPAASGEKGLFTANGSAVFVRSGKSYSIAPEKFGVEMAGFESDPAFTDTNLEAVMKMTDTAKAVTVCGQFEDLLTHARGLAGASRAQVLEWLGQTAEKSAELFLVEVGLQENFEVNAQLIPLPNTNAANIQRSFEKQFKAAPTILVNYLKQRSAMTVGQQQLAGRFPAMVQATVLSSEIDVKKNIATIDTELPMKAWPNLLLAGYSCWESSAPIYRPDQMQVAGNRVDTNQKTEKTWQQKLVTEIEIDFKRTPLQDAISFIADETKLTIDIDGDALKLSGYTKNMPQNFTLGKVLAIKGIQNILSSYDAMCLIQGDVAGTLVVTTKPVATSAGKEILNLEELAKTPPAP